MATRIMDSSDTTQMIQLHTQPTHPPPPPQEHTLLPTNPIKVREESNSQLQMKSGGNFCRKLFQILFYLHIILIAGLSIFLTVRGLVSHASQSHHFLPRKWYPPLLASTACAVMVAFVWQWFTYINPSKAMKAAFWLSPLLTCGMGILLLVISSPGSLGAAAIALVFALAQSLYACWVNSRFDYAARLLSVSVAFPPRNTTMMIVLFLTISMLVSALMVSGIGGATATGTRLDALFIFLILLSLTWTMHVIKNALQVTISHIKYMNLASGTDVDTSSALRDMIRHSIGSISLGSALLPILGLIRGSARATRLVSGNTDEFMFCCADCCSGVSSRLVKYGNRWGLVQVGAYNKGIVQASIDTWEMFQRAEMEPLIDSDLTSSFCFLCGVAGGAVSALVAGSWAFVILRGYATEVSIYAFLIGYYLFRVAMAWPQACVSAYYVAYAENPQNL